tara:strand:- start:10292 stop:11428 length:1137 start_codon:yes stop_codon:yes gene_type:complete
MKKLKVITIVGTRPEIIRLSRVISKLDIHFDHKLAHTGQNYDYELNDVFFEDLSIRKPDFYLESSVGDPSLTIGSIIIETDKLLEREKPDAVLILGDTNSCLSIIPAKRRKIPTFHMEAGNRCFDFRVPEEINRRIVDHVADINLPYSLNAKEHLMNEGIPVDMIIKTGSPMKEVLDFYKSKILESKIIDKLNLDEYNYFLVSLHREENIDSKNNFIKISDSLNTISKEYNLPIIVSTHPRTKKQIEKLKLIFDKKISFLKPLSFTDYNKLQIKAKVVLSDSGTINEESSILNFPALNLRETHERHEAMEEGAVIMTGIEKFNILSGIEILKDQKREELRSINLPSDYNVNNVSDKIVRIILSYVDYVNRKVWFKKNN